VSGCGLGTGDYLIGGGRIRGRGRKKGEGKGEKTKREERERGRMCAGFALGVSLTEVRNRQRQDAK
jgi:hypothetical protein